MITTWILIMVMNVGGYGQTSQKIEGINSEAECKQMASVISSKMKRDTNFACVPFNSYKS